MDTDKLRIILHSVPSGRWVSYSDVVAAIGGAPAATRAVNQQLIRHGLPNAHRVLKSDGRISPVALGAPDEVRAKLVAEGVEFDDKARASQEQRVRPEPIGTVDVATTSG
jgi:alkylated DNA nucleotide flippase Atl1